jgi:hypothetical protein
MHQNGDQLSAYLKAMTPIPLTKAEKLQLLNLRPKNMVGLHLVSLPWF